MHAVHCNVDISHPFLFPPPRPKSQHVRDALILADVCKDIDDDRVMQSVPPYLSLFLDQDLAAATRAVRPCVFRRPTSLSSAGTGGPRALSSTAGRAVGPAGRARKRRVSGCARRWSRGESGTRCTMSGGAGCNGRHATLQRGLINHPVNDLRALRGTGVDTALLWPIFFFPPLSLTRRSWPNSRSC